MAAYPPACANTTSTQGMNMANSIANLRLKAKEYSLNQVPTVNWVEGVRERVKTGGWKKEEEASEELDHYHKAFKNGTNWSLSAKLYWE